MICHYYISLYKKGRCVAEAPVPSTLCARRDLCDVQSFNKFILRYGHRAMHEDTVATIKSARLQRDYDCSINARDVASKFGTEELRLHAFD